jgi:tyrosyl-tRNA synthetase
MSKSLGNYVGVTDAPEEVYGKTLSVPDDAMGTWYSLLLGRDADASLGPRDAKHALARALVERFHGPEAAAAAAAHFERVFVAKDVPEDMPEASFAAGGGPVHVPGVIAEAFGTSKSEARRLVTQGGVKLDGAPLADLDVEADRLDGAVLQVGKRRFARLRRAA